MLNGTAVRVVDSLGSARLAPLFYVSPGQVNFQVPAGTGNGTAAVTLSLTGAFTAFGELSIANTAPGLFTADASGQGYPAALIYRYRNNALVGVESVARFDTAQNKIVAAPVDLGADTDTLFLALFGTGIRNRSDLSGLTATIGGADAQVTFAGAQGELVGVDQLNLRIPRSLSTFSGDVNIVINVDGNAANTVKLNLKSGSSISNMR